MTPVTRNATAAILGLYPLYRAGVVDEERTVIEVKAGSSEAGRTSSASTHHPERSGSVRSFAPTGHRHTAEVQQALRQAGVDAAVHLSATAVDNVRGVLATAHAFVRDGVAESLDLSRAQQVVQPPHRSARYCTRRRR